MKNFKLIILFLGLSLGSSVWAMDVDVDTHLEGSAKDPATADDEDGQDTSRGLANQVDPKTSGHVDATPDYSDYGSGQDSPSGSPTNMQGSGGDGTTFGATGTENASESLNDANTSVDRGLSRVKDSRSLHNSQEELNPDYYPVDVDSHYVATDQDNEGGPVDQVDSFEHTGINHGNSQEELNPNGYGVVTPFNNENGYQEVQVSPKKTTHVKLDENLYGDLNPDTRGGQGEFTTPVDDGARRKKLEVDRKNVLARQKVNTNETEPEELQSGYQEIEPDYSEDLDQSEFDNDDDTSKFNRKIEFNNPKDLTSRHMKLNEGFDDNLGTFFRENSGGQEELWDKKTGEWLSKKDYNIRNDPDYFNDRMKELVHTGVVDRTGALKEFNELNKANLSYDQRKRLNSMADDYNEYLGNRKAKSLFGRKYQSINDEADTNNPFGKKHVKYREEGSLDGRRRYYSAQSGGRKTSNVDARSQIKNMFGI